ncbi:MAG TPA: hypothetical protein VMF06_22335 [Candidatus Limnocylindria bacterium]|nr:hypothetical protein [Candidatus Limnocylindria bacterium]
MCIHQPFIGSLRRLQAALLFLALLALRPLSQGEGSNTLSLSPTNVYVPDGTVGIPYSLTFTPGGGTPPYTFTMPGGATPPGISLSANGVLGGTPTSVVGNSAFVVRVTDSLGQRGQLVKQMRVLAGGGNPNPTTYTLTVINGTGGGTYSAGTVVNVTAAPPGPGQGFSQWSGAAVANPTALATTLTMPATNVTLTATYYQLTPTDLTVIGGSGSGTYMPGTVVPIVAGPPSQGMTFDHWTGANFVSAASPSTTLAMPATATTVTAVYTNLPAPTPFPGIVNPILFVTQIPIGFDFTTIGSVFGNHRATTDTAGRGGDLYIRYPDGSLKNLTAAAGFGTGTGFQGANSIAVRDPSVHWTGTKAVFSMVVGSATAANQAGVGVWQLYEVTGFGLGETTVITKVPNQPTGYNNISPCYGSDGRIIFTTDRPRSGQAHLYPQLDEYELAATVSGVWTFDPATGDLFQLDHAPSGAFTPSVDSYGRVLFTRWDHLQQDQEADLDRDAMAKGLSIPYGTFNYSDESSSAQILYNNKTEVFPESRIASGNVNGHTFNQFFPWMINQDGTEEETLNHVGRHEIATYLQPSFNNDNSLGYFYNAAARYNTNSANNFLHIKEDPTHPGLYFGTDCPEFSTHAAGQVVTLLGPVGLDADHMTIGYITHPETKSFTDTPTTNHSGLYRDPLPMSDGTFVAVHTPNTSYETQRGVGSDFAFRLRTLNKVGAYWRADQYLTAGFKKSVSYYGPGGGMISYNGPLWEMNPVEVRSRPVPVTAPTPLGGPEQQIMDEESVDVSTLKSYLQMNNLALIVSRNVTTRDHADRQQPFNLRIAGTTNKTVGTSGKLYDVGYMQILQADQIRGFGLYTSNSAPRPGRRVLAEPLHDSAAVANNINPAAGPSGAVQLGTDGSMAAFVPARRALTWQLTDTNGGPVVRERFWLTFQPGEIRTCTSCHGVNTRDQANHPAPTNKPEALRTLLQSWKAATGLGGIGGKTESNSMTLSLQGQASAVYRLESSPDLIHWTTVGTNSTDSHGAFHFKVQTTADLPRRYYRMSQ